MKRSAISLRTARNLNLTNGTRVQRGVLASTQSDRYYRIQVRQRSSFNLALTGLTANANLALVDRQGRILSRSTRAKQSRESIRYTLNPGTYYVRVYRQQPGGRARYRLNFGINPAVAAATATARSGSSVVEQVVVLTNQHRVQAGLKPLRFNPQLSIAAQAHSQDMALNDFFGHIGSNGSTATSRVLATGYNYFAVSENVAAGFSTPEAVVQAWMNSPNHRRNILHPLMEEIGVGFFFLENDPGNLTHQSYWTQAFAAPLA